MAHVRYTRALDRCDALRVARHTRAVKELRALDSALPDNGSAIGLAHNWHACALQYRGDHMTRDERARARAVVRVLESLYAHDARIYSVKTRVGQALISWDRMTRRGW